MRSHGGPAIRFEQARNGWPCSSPCSSTIVPPGCKQTPGRRGHLTHDIQTSPRRRRARAPGRTGAPRGRAEWPRAECTAGSRRRHRRCRRVRAGHRQDRRTEGVRSCRRANGSSAWSRRTAASGILDRVDRGVGYLVRHGEGDRAAAGTEIHADRGAAGDGVEGVDRILGDEFGLRSRHEDAGADRELE